MEERFTSLVAQLTTEFASKKHLLEEQERRLATERQRLDDEIATMTKASFSDDDIVHLNVGGTIFVTKRGSLRTVPGSVLDLMFSGRWEERVDRDKDGYVFLDYDPFLFSVIVRYLVAIHSYGMAAEHLELRPIPRHLEEEFRLMLQHLGMEELIQPKVRFRWSPALKTPHVTLAKDGRIARADGSVSLRHHVLSGEIYQRGVYKFRIFVEFLEEWGMLGVVGEDVRPTSTDDLIRHPSAHGWGSDGTVYIRGEESSKQGYPGRAFRTGDCLKLTVDGRYGTLTLVAPIGEELLEYKIPHLSGNRWRLVWLTYFGSSEIDVTPQ